MAPVSDPTPVKVRGKRNALSAEKWTSGRRRDPELKRRPGAVALTQDGESQPASTRPRKRRRSDPESPLEMLPAEILQEIFEYAGNVDLPCVSRQLAAKLSQSQHLQNELTTRLLEPILGLYGPGRTPLAPASHRAAATRLLNSRFVTYDFLSTWIKNHAAATSPSDLPEAGLSEEKRLLHFWYSTLRPTRGLLPPRKLLSPPFTEDKLSFFHLFVGLGRADIPLDAAFAETAQEALKDAVRANSTPMVAMILSMGLRADTELLRIAVTEAGCNEDMVACLIEPVLTFYGEIPGDADLLDPTIWSWAERASQQGDSKGAWLISFLKEKQRR